MLCGHIGMPGAGVNPLRGQNNVQGACDMGGLPDVFSGYQKVADAQARAAGWQRPGGSTSLPATPGLKVTEMLPAAHDGTLKAMYIIGENPLVSDPDLNHAEKSLRAARVPGGAGHLPDRDRPAGRRGAARGLLCGERRHLLQHRAPGAAGAQGGRAARAMPANDWEIVCDDRHPHGIPHVLRQTPGTIMDEIRRVTPILCRHQLRAHRTRGHPLALPQRGAPGDARSCTGSSSPAARACSTPSTLSRRRNGPTAISRSTSPPAGCSTSTTPAR